MAKKYAHLKMLKNKFFRCCLFVNRRKKFCNYAKPSNCTTIVHHPHRCDDHKDYNGAKNLLEMELGHHCPPSLFLALVGMFFSLAYLGHNGKYRHGKF